MPIPYANMCSMRQMSLLAVDELSIPEEVGALERFDLGNGAWIDWCPNWLPGAEWWLRRLRDELPWRSAERPMYDRIVAVPRLTAHFARPAPPTEAQPPLEFDDLATRFERHYARPFPTIGCNWYRDGNDSVAWHADRVRRPGDSIVAIIGVGERRPFLLRAMPGHSGGHSGGHGGGHSGKRCGGRSRRWLVGDGDLIVLGGTIQAGWQHAVPKVRHAGERISIMVRSGDRPSERPSGPQ